MSIQKVPNGMKFVKREIKIDNVQLPFNELVRKSGKKDRFRRNSCSDFIFRSRATERDISEQIALGVQSVASSGLQYDQ